MFRKHIHLSNYELVDRLQQYVIKSIPNQFHKGDPCPICQEGFLLGSQAIQLHLGTGQESLHKMHEGCYKVKS